MSFSQCLLCGSPHADAIFTLFCVDCVAENPDVFSNPAENILARFQSVNEMLTAFSELESAQEQLSKLMLLDGGTRIVDLMAGQHGVYMTEITDTRADSDELMDFRPNSENWDRSIGIQLNLAFYSQNDNRICLHVRSVKEHGAAARSGLRGGDRIHTVDNVPVTQLGRKDFWINGFTEFVKSRPRGSVVKLGIRRDNTDMTVELKLGI